MNNIKLMIVKDELKLVEINLSYNKLEKEYILQLEEYVIEEDNILVVKSRNFKYILYKEVDSYIRKDVLNSIHRILIEQTDSINNFNAMEKYITINDNGTTEYHTINK